MLLRKGRLVHPVYPRYLLRKAKRPSGQDALLHTGASLRRAEQASDVHPCRCQQAGEFVACLVLPDDSSLDGAAADSLNVEGRIRCRARQSERLLVYEDGDGSLAGEAAGSANDVAVEDDVTHDKDCAPL
jgi:hypothetical protein